MWQLQQQCSGAWAVLDRGLIDFVLMLIIRLSVCWLYCWQPSSISCQAGFVRVPVAMGLISNLSLTLFLVQMAEYSINAKVSGIIRHIDFLDKWKQHPDVLYARPLVKVRPGCTTGMQQQHGLNPCCSNWQWTVFDPSCWAIVVWA